MEEYLREDVIDQNGKVRYFAYENNMSVKSMSRKCPSASFLGVVKLPDHRFIINEQGSATVIPKAAARVYGVLWLLSEADEKTLDHYKRIGDGPYTKKIREIEVSEGETVKAMLYVSWNFVYGVPGKSYLDEILANAEKHNFPRHYINELRQWTKKDGPGEDETIVLPR
jgi:hypothetical protein